MVSNFNGSHFGLPPSSIHRMTGLGGKMVWTMTYSQRPHLDTAVRSDAEDCDSTTHQGLMHLPTDRRKETHHTTLTETPHTATLSCSAWWTLNPPPPPPPLLFVRTAATRAQLLKVLDSTPFPTAGSSVFCLHLMLKLPPTGQAVSGACLLHVGRDALTIVSNAKKKKKKRCSNPCTN